MAQPAAACLVCVFRDRRFGRLRLRRRCLWGHLGRRSVHEDSGSATGGVVHLALVSSDAYPSPLAPPYRSLPAAARLVRRAPAAAATHPPSLTPTRPSRFVGVGRQRAFISCTRRRGHRFEARRQHEPRVRPIRRGGARGQTHNLLTLACETAAGTCRAVPKLSALLTMAAWNKDRARARARRDREDDVLREAGGDGCDGRRGGILDEERRRRE